jgi:hypothetical protein
MQRLTLYEAKIRAARAEVALENARLAWTSAPDDTDDERKAKAKWEQAKSNKRRLMGELAADAELRKHMTCLCVWFEGSAEPAWVGRGVDPSPAEMARTLNNDDNLVSRKVQEWILSKGFTLAGCGGGAEGWDMDVVASYEDATRLCDLALVELGEYLEAGVLSVSLRDREFRFKGFNLKDMLKLLGN